MLKKRIKYTNWEGEEVEETFHFHLSMPELLELENEFGEGGLNGYFQRIIETKQNDKLLALFKRLLLMSYGERSEDGKRFVKSDELSNGFTQTAAYEALYMELAMQENAAAEFVLGIMPQGLKERVDGDALRNAAAQAAGTGARPEEFRLPPPAGSTPPPPPVIGEPPARP